MSYSRNKGRDPGRSLVKILRHSAKDRKIPMDSGGWVSLDYLLNLGEFREVTLEQVQNIVAVCNKQRMKLEQRPNGWYIRANQGHSITTVQSTELLTPITLETVTNFPVVLHGTYYKSWDMIKATGLNKMSRQHIHFAIGLPGQNSVISGMRSSCQVLVYVDLKKCLEANIPFFVSANNVILSPGLGTTGAIPSRFILKAVDYKTIKPLPL